MTNYQSPITNKNSSHRGCYFSVTLLGLKPRTFRGQNLFFFSAPSAGSTLAVDKKRETLHFEIGIFSFFHQPLDGFILDIRHTAAFQAYDLHARAGEDYQFVLIIRFTALPVIHMQYLRVYQQLQHIIHRSHRDMFRFARLHQQLSRKGLR